jgi:ubiquinone/menaquinone biosynthesis C-methylase UbiE
MIKRLAKKNLNTPQEYKKLVCGHYSDFDKKRWRLLLKKFQGGRLLDVGCFDGDLLGMAFEKYPEAQYYAVDFNEQAIWVIMGKYSFVDGYVADANRLPFPKDYFDYVTAGELMEHLEDPVGFVMEAMRTIKPGGYLAISVPKEETGRGEVDRDHHVWSFSVKDVETILGSYGPVKTAVIKRIWPSFDYHHPIIIAWVRKIYEPQKSKSFKKRIREQIRALSFNV